MNPVVLLRALDEKPKATPLVDLFYLVVGVRAE